MLDCLAKFALKYVECRDNENQSQTTNSGLYNKITRPTNCACSEIKTKDQLLAIEEHELETSKAGLVDSTSAVPAESLYYSDLTQTILRMCPP